MQYIDDYKSYLTHDRRLCHQTINGYVYLITRFMEFLGRDPAIVTNNDIRDMFKYLAMKKMKNSSIAKYIMALRSFYNWMHYAYKSEMTTDVSFYLNKIVRSSSNESIPQVPTDNEAKTIRECMIAYKKAISFNKEVPAYKLLLRDLAAIEMFIATAARSNELKNMMVKELNWTENTALIKKGKGNKQRVVIFGDTAKVAVMEYIEEWKLTEQDFLFKFTRFNLFYEIVKRWAYKSGINPNIYPHSLRHYHVTKAYKDGVKLEMISDQLGHASMNTTRRYLHVDHNLRREKYKDSDLQK